MDAKPRLRRRHQGNLKFGALFKRASDLQPTTTVYNTVVAVDSPCSLKGKAKTLLTRSSGGGSAR